MQLSEQELYRFLDKFQTQGDPEACWPWLAFVDPDGYGRFGRRARLAHRVSFETFVGAIPAGHQVHHTCEQRACVNPHHLEALTRKAHARRHKRRFV